MASAAERPTRRVLRARVFLLTFVLLLLLPTSASPAPPTLSKYDPLRLLPTGRIILGQNSLNLNCGGERIGTRFIGEQYSWIVGGVSNTDRDSKPNARIGGSEPKNAPALKSNRYGKPTFNGKWGYKIPVENPGIFGCTVHFAEIDATVKKGQRVFNLEIKAAAGSETFNNIDVVASGDFTGVVRTAKEPLVVTRYIEVLVQKTPASKHGAIINAITCERNGSLPAGTNAAPKPKQATSPIAIMPIGRTFPSGPKMEGTTFNVNCGSTKTVGKWLKDEQPWRHYGRNTIFPATNPNIGIGGSTGDELIALRTSAYGVQGATFGYQIPVTRSGVWECHLLFAELDDKKNIGDRVFDVQVQDQKLPRYDILGSIGGAHFTKTVLTFVTVPVIDNIAIILKPMKGDASINAIECNLKKPMTEDEVKKVLAARQIQAGNKPEFQSPTPSTESGTLPDASPGPSELVRDVTLEKELQDQKGEVIQFVRLGLAVPKDTIVDNNLKNSIKEIVTKYTKATKGHVAVTRFKQIPNGFAVIRMLRWVVRSFSDEPVSFINDEAYADSDEFLDYAARMTTTADETSFECGTQYQVPSDLAKTSTESMTKACSGDECSTELQALGCKGCTLKLLAVPTTLAGQGATSAAGASGTSTSTIVAAVVGSCLVALLLVAVIVFFVVRRNRDNEVNPAAFDAPPPEMEDSDGSAPSSSEHSESQRSVDYLDDDSTFTAATSHQADPEAGVTLDKDVWGRGSS